MIGRLVLALLALHVAGPVIAHEGPGSPPYLYTVEGDVEKTSIASWTEAVGVLITAHDEHEEGQNWVVFRELTGGPDIRVVFFRGFAELAELDRWPTTREVLVDALGPTRGQAAREALRRGTEFEDRVMSRVDELSNPWTGHDPPAYLWVATTRVADGKMTEYAALAKRVRRAFEREAGDLRWMCYAFYLSLWALLRPGQKV